MAGLSFSADGGTHTTNMFVTPRDPLVHLDGMPAARMARLDRRVIDARGRVPDSAEVREAREVKRAVDARIEILLRRRSEGGHGVDEASPMIRSLRQEQKRATEAVDRLTKLEAELQPVATVAGQLARAVAEWVLTGVPAACELIPLEDPPIERLLKKGERPADAVARYQAEVQAHTDALRKLHRMPHTTIEAHARVKAQVLELARAGQPDVSRVALFLEPARFPVTMAPKLAPSVDPKGLPAIITNETVDPVALFAFLFPDVMTEKLCALIPEAEGVSVEDRQREDVRLNQLIFAAERAEVALIWHLDGAGTVLPFRAGTSAQAVLGVELKTRPRAEPSPGSSPGLSWEVIGPGR